MKPAMKIELPCVSMEKPRPASDALHHQPLSATVDAPLPKPKRDSVTVPPGQLSVARSAAVKLSVTFPGDDVVLGEAYAPLSVCPPRYATMSPMNELPATGPAALNHVARPSA